MVSELSDEHGFTAHFINETVFAINAPGPVAGECVPEWFWFTNAFMWRALDIFDQQIDAFQNFLVGFLPVQVVVPRVLRKYKLHSCKAFSSPLPCSSWAMESTSL